jgi:hypothetical protein
MEDGCGGGGCVFQEICEFSEPPDQLNILLLSWLIKVLLSHSCSLFMCGRHSLLQLFPFSDRQAILPGIAGS